nr:MFS transporter [Nocardioides marinus]
MSQLGALLLVSTATGSYGLGGLAAGALAVANALGAPVAGALADRVGQRPVVLVQSLLGATGLVALVAQVGGSTATTVLIAALAGLAMPQVGPLARVRWRPLTHGREDQPRLVDAAFAYEGAADEASFALGPALVGLLAVAIDPGGALLAAAGLLAVFGTAFALDHSAVRTHAYALTHAHLGGAERLLSAALVVLALAQLCIGVLFGATQTGATVLATAAGNPGAAGFVHATLGVGSAVAGLATAYLPARIGYERRALGAAVALLVLSTPLLLVGSLLTVTLAVLALGCAVAPYMIAVFTLGERVVPPTRVGAAMTVLASATGIGYALGASVAGRLADATGSHTGAFAVTVTTTVAATALLALSQRRLAAPAGPAREPAVA